MIKPDLEMGNVTDADQQAKEGMQKYSESIDKIASMRELVGALIIFLTGFDMLKTQVSFPNILMEIAADVNSLYLERALALGGENGKEKVAQIIKRFGY